MEAKKATSNNGPAPEKVGQIVGGLIGRSVTVKRIPPVTAPSTAAKAVGVYVRDDEVPRGAVVADLPMVVNAGAALTLYPPADAARCVKVGQWNSQLTENFNEVLNVSANLFNQVGAPHARLLKVCLSPEPLPEALEKALKSATNRLDVEVTIPGYGPGKISVLTF